MCVYDLEILCDYFSDSFMSTLVTAVLTHHLAWVPTVTPAGGTPSKTYLHNHSAKWVCVNYLFSFLGYYVMLKIFFIFVIANKLS